MYRYIFGLAFLAVAFAQYSPSAEYLPPNQDVAAAPSNEYLAPAVEEPATAVAADGYRYKTVRRLRHRRDVSELPSAEYLPPTQEAPAAPAAEYLAPAVEEQQQTILADDGYHYKTVRRLRHRRDVSELPSAEYLPPHQEVAAAPSAEYLAPAAAEEQQTVLADDGYHYKTVRRLRHRRDVSELPSAEYLPPTQEAPAAPAAEYLAPAIEEQQQTILADDGYHYKTVRRLRHRRDVNELPSAEYLPPNQEVAAAPSAEYLAPAAAEEQQTVLADDGYHYKTVRRLRHRRDVSELPSAEYLPPTQEATAPAAEYLAPAAAEEQQTVLADDGYHYKTVRRFRHRRDVSELPSAEYLPPNQEAAAAPSAEYLAPAVEEATPVGNDGYRYKTVRKYKIRRH